MFVNGENDSAINFDSADDEQEKLRNIMGLGDLSARKSYYPELQSKIDELNEEKNKYERIFSEAMSGIFLAEIDGGIMVANPAMIEMCGYSSDEFITISNINSQLFYTTSEAEKFKTKVNEKGSVVGFETRFRKRNDAVIDVSVNASMRNSHSQLVEFFVQDITERKKADEDLHQLTLDLFMANKELTEHKEHLEELVYERTAKLQESLDELKKTQNQLVESEKMASLGALVAGIAHEINTPVGIGVTAASHLEQKTKHFIEIYKSGKLSRNEMESFCNIALNSSQIILSNMTRAAELIKSFKQVAVDRSSQEQRSFNIDQYVKGILSSLHPQLKKTKHKIIVNCDETLQIYSYPGALSQILTNLLMNSLKHGFENIAEGIITIDIVKQNDMIRLTYHDSGKGITEENLSKIFDPFFTTRRGSGGSGLGMHIVYNLVTQTLAGSITCSSEPDKGTTFDLEFPFQ